MDYLDFVEIKLSDGGSFGFSYLGVSGWFGGAGRNSLVCKDKNYQLKILFNTKG